MKVLGGLVAVNLLSGCAIPPVAPQQTPTVEATIAAPGMLRVRLEATTTGSGMARVVYRGDPASPGDRDTTFRHAWMHEFDMPLADRRDVLLHSQIWVTDQSGTKVRVTCRISIDGQRSDEQYQVGRHAETTCVGAED